MRKFFTPLYILALFIISLNAQSQSFTLWHNETSIFDDDVINIEHDITNDGIKVIVYITNETQNEIGLRAKVRRVEEEITGSYHTFCLGSCYEPGTTESTSTFNLPASQTSGNDDFYFLYYPNGNHGTMRIIYELYNVDDIDDKISFTVNLTILPVGVPFNQMSLRLKAFPNPIGTQHSNVTISYSVPINQANPRVVIYNMLGVVVYESVVLPAKGRLELDVTRFPKGIYMYSIESNGRNLITRKLMINK